MRRRRRKSGKIIKEEEGEAVRSRGGHTQTLLRKHTCTCGNALHALYAMRRKRRSRQKQRSIQEPLLLFPFSYTPTRFAFHTNESTKNTINTHA